MLLAISAHINEETTPKSRTYMLTRSVKTVGRTATIRFAAKALEWQIVQRGPVRVKKEYTGTLKLVSL